MSINNLNFSRDWTKPKDFPTLEENEEIVRQDMQFLHNETKEFLNSEVVPAVNKNREDIDANAEHLARVDITTSVHDTHFNKTDIEVALLKQDAHTHANKDVLDGIEAVTETLGNSTTKVPSEKAVSDALTQSGGMPGGGATGQVLAKKSDAGFDTEWKSVTDIGAAPTVHGHAVDDVSGVLPAEKGGTGKTTLKNSANAFINALDAGTSAPKDDDYFISQYVGGGTSNIDYYRRKISTLWTYIKGKADAVYAALSHTHAAGDITSGTFDAARIPSLNTSKLTAGTLGVARGGTGQTSAAAALSALINGGSALAATGLATDDYIGVRDTSATTGKKVTIANLATFILENQKPMGTYTGTEASRTVNVGGNGKALFVWSGTTRMAFVTSSGTMWFRFSGTSVAESKFISSNTFAGGVLTLTPSDAINKEDTEYTYQVL